ncbi:MAG: hypothetical protein KBF45_02900 [Cyclobacteriaceae bacterium]|jgi:hypothetical protein|nr:hypothetical protein [Cyclobacteriaceae bacterium]
MEFSLDSIKRLFENLKTIGFLGRIFQWGSVKSQLIEANGELQRIISISQTLKAENGKLENSLSLEKSNSKNFQDTANRLSTELEVLKNTLANQTERIESLQKETASLLERNTQFLKRGTELSADLVGTRQKIEILEKEVREIKEENARLKKDDEFRKQEHSNAVSSLKQIQEKIQKDREDEITRRNLLEIERIKNLKETWVNHEDKVRNRIRTICNKTGVEYVDKVPFKGKPDNTLRINDEYIIFDAKSPANDDLSNFPNYVKAQAESAIKYVKEEDVRREVFLVVPTNTLEHLEIFEYRLSDYTVFVVSLDSLEPIILTLKRIEDYEFAEQLSPEERENICRVIGKFVHLSKRRIQIDGFFAKQFFELVYRSEADLSKEILEKVAEFEKSEKLNPPQEKRARQISTKELEQDAEKIQSEASQKGISVQDSLLIKEINKLPLYSDIESDKNQRDLFN